MKIIKKTIKINIIRQKGFQHALVPGFLIQKEFQYIFLYKKKKSLYNQPFNSEQCSRCGTTDVPDLSQWFLR